MNFVCGENGSGKTAVLHGLQTCLGVSAKQSGRASSAAALIKDDANHSRAAATLWNTGHDAFLPKRYGSEVTIVREMKRTATGATSSWAILDERGKKARLLGTAGSPPSTLIELLALRSVLCAGRRQKGRGG